MSSVTENDANRAESGTVGNRMHQDWGGLVRRQQCRVEDIVVNNDPASRWAFRPRHVENLGVGTARYQRVGIGDVGPGQDLGPPFGPPGVVAAVPGEHCLESMLVGIAHPTAEYLEATSFGPAPTAQGSSSLFEPDDGHWLGHDQPRYRLVMGSRRSLPKARVEIRTPGAVWRRLYSARSTSRSTRLTTSGSNPAATISSEDRSPST